MPRSSRRSGATTSPRPARSPASGRRPNGDSLYRTQIRAWTTLDLPPEEIHRIGLEELEIDRARPSRDRPQRPASATTRRPTGRRCRRSREHPEVQGRADRARRRGHRPGDGDRAALLRDAPRGRLRRQAGRGVQGEGRAVRLLLPAVDRRHAGPGIYYANGYDLPSRKYTKLASTTYHEAVPGHHFQIALEMENPNLNTFRRLGARIVGGAYVEGWGLYSEKLADEMGLFRDEARAVRDARRGRLAGGPARRRHRHPCAALGPPAVDRLPARRRPVRDRRDDRDRPLHRLAGPGPDLHDRAAARSSGCAGRSRRGMARRSTCGRSTTRCSATARCRSRRSPASSRTGWPRRPERTGGARHYGAGDAPWRLRPAGRGAQDVRTPANRHRTASPQEEVAT